MGDGVDLLLVVGDADGDERPCARAAVQRAVVEAAAVAEPIAAASNARSGTSTTSGSSTASSGGSAMPHTPLPISSPGAQARNSERLALALHHRQRQRGSPRLQAAQQRPGAISSASGAEAGDDAARLASRKSSPCCATAAAARSACRRQPCAPSRDARRSARFASMMSDVSLTQARVEPDRAGWRNKRKMAAKAVEASIPLGPYECRWAPCVRDHGPGQGQLPCGSYRPRGYVLVTHPAALHGMNLRCVRKKAMRRSVVFPADRPVPPE